MARYGRPLTEAQWEKIRPLLPKQPKRPRGGCPRAHDRKVLEGSCGFCAAGLAGRICRKNFRIRRPAADACETGRSKRSGCKSGARFSAS